MSHSEHLLRALAISIPMGVVFGLSAGFLRRCLGKRLAERHPSGWERFKQSIFGIGVFMFAALSVYCYAVIQHRTFGNIYAVMSFLNLICLLRSFAIGKTNHDGVPVRLQRKPRRVTPIVDVPVPQPTATVQSTEG